MNNPIAISQALLFSVSLAWRANASTSNFSSIGLSASGTGLYL